MMRTAIIIVFAFALLAAVTAAGLKSAGLN
jgi:hypothetical protein